MGRYAGGGKATVESCRSIEVLDWHRRSMAIYDLHGRSRGFGLETVNGSRRSTSRPSDTL